MESVTNKLSYSMNYLKNAIGHFKTIMKHKYWVYKYSKMLGIPCQGILHDLSKFSWTEFSESVKFYQEGKSSPIVAAKQAQGYSLAWLHHRSHNKHHYEYWTDNYDSGTIALKMPFKYVIELIADYLGAGRAYNGESFTLQSELDWWLTKIKGDCPPKMHQESINLVTHIFKKFVETGIEKINTPKLKQHYEAGYFGLEY